MQPQQPACLGKLPQLPMLLAVALQQRRAQQHCGVSSSWWLAFSSGEMLQDKGRSAPQHRYVTCSFLGSPSFPAPHTEATQLLTCKLVHPISSIHVHMTRECCCRQSLLITARVYPIDLPTILGVGAHACDVAIIEHASCCG